MSKKQIHIEKYDFDAFEKEKKPFTMIRTDVVQRIPATRIKEAFFWVYLESLPETWKPNKQHLMKHFDISERTYDRYMSWLNAVFLIEYRQNRLDNGSFGKGILIVLNGEKFNPDAAFNRTVKIGGTAVNRSHKGQVVQLHRSANLPMNGETEGSAGDAHINTINKSYKDKIEKKQRQQAPQKPIIVFSCKDDVKNHVENRFIATEKPVDDDLVSQILYYIGDTLDSSDIKKKTNIALKKIREGKWNIPNGWEGITYQSIVEKEETDQATKRVQYQEEAKAFKEIAKAVLSPSASNALAELKKKLAG
jgi:hypothetical protein